jgi:drug/metabolite transporter (DMT)-like permease
MMKPTRFLTWACLTALILVWGTTWAAIRIGLRGIPPVTGVALRFAIASAVLLALVPAFGVKLGRSGTERRLWGINAVSTFIIPYGILYWAEQWVPSGLAAVLFATFPLLTAVIAHFVLPGERLTARGIVGILIGFAGVAVIFSEDFHALGGSRVLTAAAILLISPISAAFGGVAVKRWGAGVHPISTSAVPMGLTAIVMGILAFLIESGRHVAFNTPSILALLYLALCGSALPFTLYFWLLKHQTATSMSLINYVTPVIAVTVGTLFLDEPFTVRIVIGAALVLMGVGLALRKGSGKAMDEAPAPEPGEGGLPPPRPSA